MSHATPQSDLSSPALPQGRRGVWPLVLVAATVVWTAAMMASLWWRFLDRFTPGATCGLIGFDFFHVPRGFCNLLAGTSAYFTEISGYGPYATSNYDHLFVTLAMGSWTAALPPWVAFGLFTAVSLAIEFLSARLLASVFDTPTRKAFCYFAMFCCLPVYNMLWEGQMHVFIVLAVTLILTGLVRLERQPQSANRYLRWIQTGLLISLLFKPIVVLIVPALFAVPEVRRKLVLPLAVYAAVSLAFLLVPRLNPGGCNGIHWVYILNASFNVKPWHGLVFPSCYDLSTNPAVYALPLLLYRACGGGMAPYLAKLPLAAVALMSLAPFILPQRAERIRAALVAAALGVLAYNLGYYQTWEYHYTALLPVMLTTLWLWRHETTPWLRRLLAGSFLLSMVITLPTPYFLGPEDSKAFWIASALLRVAPVVVSFLCLFVYGIAFSWRARRRPALIDREMLRRLPAAIGLGTALAALAAAVLAAVYWTVPGRLLKSYDRWDRHDWTAHFEDVVSRPGLSPEASGRIHWMLGESYRAVQPRVALEHYRALMAVGFDTEYKELADALIDLSGRDEAVKPGCAELLARLAWRLATCPDERLRNGPAAVELAREADELCGGRPETLQALAAAYAEAGMRSEAVETARRALDLARKENKPALVEQLTIWLQRYEAGTIP